MLLTSVLLAIGFMPLVAGWLRVLLPDVLMTLMEGLFTGSRTRLCLLVKLRGNVEPVPDVLNGIAHFGLSSGWLIALGRRQAEVLRSKGDAVVLFDLSESGFPPGLDKFTGLLGPSIIKLHEFVHEVVVIFRDFRNRAWFSASSSFSCVVIPPEHRLFSAGGLSTPLGLKKLWYQSVWSRGDQHASHVGAAGVGVVSLHVLVLCSPCSWVLLLSFRLPLLLVELQGVFCLCLMVGSLCCTSSRCMVSWLFGTLRSLVALTGCCMLGSWSACGYRWGL